MCRTQCLRSQKETRTGRVVLCAVTVAICCAVLAGQPRVLRSEEGDGTASAAPTIQRNTDEAPRKKDQQKKAMVGLLVLVGITMAGLGLLALVIFWGHRIRRISRKQLPQAGRGDELFYLKSPKNHLPDHDKAAAAPQATTDNDSDYDSSIE